MCMYTQWPEESLCLEAGGFEEPDRGAGDETEIRWKSNRSS